MRNEIQYILVIPVCVFSLFYATSRQHQKLAFTKRKLEKQIGE